MNAKIGDVVRIVCCHSKYDGVVGEVFDYQESSGYAVVDMPKGTENKRERIIHNAIIEEMKRRENTRKTPITRWPKGDPQWFPLCWLTALGREQQTFDIEMTGVAK